ncbi:hypothetical protein [Sorangium sp. So ce1000]|uniref:hypothetical protein n=1 Tax=Sorangium sp. So ce1000 TaxID=3133325 RepID=UPI003F606BF0
MFAVLSGGSPFAKRQSPSISNRFLEGRANRIGAKIDQKQINDEELAAMATEEAEAIGYPSTAM